MDDKVTYDTMIRMAASWSGLAQAVQTILRYYSWQRVVVLNDQANGVPCTYGASAIVSLLNGSPVLAVPVFMKTSALTAADYADYLSTVQKNGRGKRDSRNRQFLHIAFHFSLFLTSVTVNMRNTRHNVGEKVSRCQKPRWHVAIAMLYRDALCD